MTETLFVEEEEKVNGKEKNTGLTVFENNEFGEIRTLVKNNQPYFVVRDICEALELKQAADAIRTLKENYELICELNIDDVYKKIRL
jgi:prophage antirepressor-like protein